MIELKLSDDQRRVLVRALESRYGEIDDFIAEGCSDEEQQAGFQEMYEVDMLLDLIDEECLWKDSSPALTLIQGGKR